MKDSSYYSEQMKNYQNKINNILELLPPYCRHYFDAKSGPLQSSSLYAYADNLYSFFAWLKAENPLYKDKLIRDIPLDDLNNLTNDDIDAYLGYMARTLGNENTTLNRKLAALRSFFSYMQKTKRIQNNPMVWVEQRKEPKNNNIITLSPEEKSLLFSSLHDGFGFTEHHKNTRESLYLRDKAILYVFLGTGIRVSELVGLDLADYVPVLKVLYITRKGGNKDHVYLSYEVMEAIDDYINHSREDFRPDEKAKNALFLSRKHNRISVRTVEHMVKTYATAALGSNTKISPHKLRATFATEAYAAFSDIGIVATCLGHRDMNTTKEHYAKISEESKQKVTGLSIEKSN